MKRLKWSIRILFIFSMAACSGSWAILTPISPEAKESVQSTVSALNEIYTEQAINTEKPSLTFGSTDAMGKIQLTISPTIATNIAQSTLTLTPAPTPGLLDQLPPGLYVAFIKKNYPNDILSIFLMSLEGKEYGPLIEDIAENITISPNGKNVAFTKFIDYGVYRLRLVNLRTNQIRELQVPNCILSDNTPAWSPDSKYLAIACDYYISIVSIENDTPVITTTFYMADEEETILNPSWSPDGKYLSFYIAPRPFEAHEFVAHVPYLIESKCPQSSNECQIRPISLGIGSKLLSRWTPDNLLAIAQNNRIDLFDPATKRLARTIPFSEETLIFSFIWSPDNQWIAYIDVSENLRYSVYLMPASGGEPRLVSESVSDVVFWVQIEK